MVAYVRKLMKGSKRKTIALLGLLIATYIILWQMRTKVTNLPQESLSAEKYFKVVANLSTEQKQYEVEISALEENADPSLGDQGVAAFLPSYMRLQEKQALSKYAVNTILSDRISLRRKLGYFSHPLCKTRKYQVKSRVTVIIIFFNELFSLIIRTVWSILDATPSHLLDQIILVDDFSDISLNEKLDYYIKTRMYNAPILLTRLPRRSGLIRARLHGARLARSSADILLFLDAHCEVTNGYLEPLIERIELDKTTIPIPVIDLISETTFEYSTNADSTIQVGGFTWDGTFDWIDIQKVDAARRKTDIDPIRSPTMAGGLFAIDRKYFWEIGSYDEQMDGWGGENLEISFRVWQCGGSLQIIPCSRIGHVFRDFHPYKFPDNKDTHGINTARMAKVWMDDYARLFFLHRQNLQSDSITGDLIHRKMFRQKMRCKSFKWYLENVYPEKFILDENVLAYGRVENRETTLCLDDLQNDDKNIYSLGVYSCFRVVQPTQFFSLSLTGELRKESACAEVVGRGTKYHQMVEMTKCHGQKGTQEWKLTTEHQIKNVGTGMCLDISGLTDSDQIYVTKCRKSVAQKFFFDTVVDASAQNVSNISLL